MRHSPTAQLLRLVSLIVAILQTQVLIAGRWDEIARLIHSTIFWYLKQKRVYTRCLCRLFGAHYDGPAEQSLGA